MSEVKKLGFYEIGQGKLASEVQALFEQAQIEARERNQGVSVELKIFVDPPEASDVRFGKVSFSTLLKVPPHKSMDYTTELKDGVIINTGDSMLDLLQTELELPMAENTRPFEKAAQ
ncbi:MAG: hypothetical protein PHE17_18025 [Thiothrix sp.]|uniref:hypothetical protein n=1 Tax=Thiothrix sp. TaxID=1032 RepID=UPI00262BB32F|nr:hypothetical protein [Thiothrix sp.]MDD5394919.1 hypothetical protein [Thiothrix sp.]